MKEKSIKKVAVKDYPFIGDRDLQIYETVDLNESKILQDQDRIAFKRLYVHHQNNKKRKTIDL